MNLYDYVIRTIAGAIGLYSPNSAVEYLKQHQVYDAISKRAYLAAKGTGSDANWRAPSSSGATENVAAWQAVTNKARDLARNNPYIVGARRRFRANVICEGVWPRPKIRKPGAKSKHDLNREFNQSILDRWEVWAPAACANGDSIYQLQRTAANHLFDDGQFLVRKVFSRTFPFLTLELLECDVLDTGRDRLASRGNNKIVGGIELDNYNKPVAYWLFQAHPSEVSTQSLRVPADQIIHVFDRQRASDVTGICGYASVVENFFRIKEYSYSTMDAARLQNHFGVFIESPYIDEYGNEAAVKAGMTLDGAPDRRHKYITPSGIHYVLPGEKPHMVKPENPGSQYSPFLTKELQAASVGAGVGYESISNDGSQTNFAGSRALLIIERAYTKMSLALLEEQLHTKIYRWFIETELSFGKPQLVLPDYQNKPNEYLRAGFSRPIQEWVDPLKDINAIARKIELGVSTITDECENMGRDVEEIVATQQYEKSIGLNSITTQKVSAEDIEESSDIAVEEEYQENITTEKSDSTGDFNSWLK